ncbi:MAG: FprA family A-type flavoprotein [Treponemataceae bacterium]|nr:FprA family A-type flavoprotein [Treponemataceae bacterium]
MYITDDIVYIGVNDHKIDLFESQYPVPEGISYNSYVIFDEKTAVMDSVDGAFGEEWLANLKKALNGKKPDYLVVQHMEMDHSACITQFTAEYPDTVLVASKLAFVMMKNLFGTDFPEKQIVIAENSTLSLGKHKLRFVAAPNVHWPEVMFTYDETEKILFTADAFGTFGALDTKMGTATGDDWKDEARRYYIGIVGKFGTPVQAVLKKAEALNIEKICPLHGPVLTENLSFYLNLYNTWSSYEAESDDIFIAYTSVYGNTRKAVEKLEKLLRDKGAKVKTADLARSDMSWCVAEAFRCKKLVLATTTYCGGIFPPMQTYINSLTERNFQKRTVALMENGSWNPVAAKTMASMLEKSGNITYTTAKVTIKSALNEASSAQVEALADELVK